MTQTKVRARSIYTFKASLTDIMFREHCPTVQDGKKVRVINLPGCPTAGTMGQCYIEDASTKEFLGMCSVNSLSR